MNRSPYTKEGAASALTRADVDRLLLDHNSTAARISVLRKVSGLYDPSRLSESEQLLAEQIFRLLVRDSVEKIRESLAESLKDNPHIPKDIIHALAGDAAESVASPILSMSDVLTDSDIVNIIQHTKEVWRYLAISRRPMVSKEISGALVDTSHQSVISSLLDNKGVAFSDEAYGKIADIAKDLKSQEIADKLASQPSLPVAVVEKLMSAVSEGIAVRLSDSYGVDREQLESGAHHALEKTTLELITIHNDRAQTAELVSQLYHSDRLTASLIINALCHGNLDFFEISLGMLAQIPMENAQALISDRGRLGFSAIYDKSGLPMSMQEAVRLLLQAVQRTIADQYKPGSASFAPHVVNHMVALAQERPVENLSYVMALIRQNAKAVA